MTLAAILVIAALLLWSFARGPEGKISIARIGMVTEDESEEMDILYRFIKQMPAIKGSCEIESLSMEEAMEELKAGNLNMVILAPKDFMYDAEHMRDTQLKLYVPGNDALANDRVYALLSSVETLMATTESAIIGMYEGMEYHEYNTTVTDMENCLTDMYVNDFLNREDYYDIEYLSAYGNFGPFMYYGIVAVLLVNLMLGAFMLSGYSGSILETERLLAAGDFYKIKITLLKTLCFALPFWIFGIFEYFVFYRACDYLRIDAVFSLPLVLTLLLIGICFSAFVGMYAALVGNGRDNRGLYVLLVILLWLISLASFGNVKILPTSCSLFALLSAASGDVAAGPVLCVAAYIIIFAALIVLIQGKRRDNAFVNTFFCGNHHRKNHSIYFKWLCLKLKQYLTSIVFWIESAVLVLIILVVYVMIQKSLDTNLVAFVPSEHLEKTMGAISESGFGGFEYYEVKDENALKSAVVSGKALAGIDTVKDKIKLYAPVGSYSAILLRELIYPYLLKESSPAMFGGYLKGLGLSDSSNAYKAAYDANNRLLNDFDISIFEVTEVDTANAVKKTKVDALLVCVAAFILICCVFTGVYESKSHRAFLKMRNNFVRITLMIESGIIRGLLLMAVAALMIPVIGKLS